MAPIAFPSSLLPNSCRPYYMICIDDLLAVKLVSCFPGLFISKESHVFTSAATLLHPYLRPISLSRGVYGCPFRLLWFCDRLPAECIGNAVCAFRLDGSISIDRTTSKGYDVTRLIAEADEDGNGAINLQEFCKHMRKRYVRRREQSQSRAAPNGPCSSWCAGNTNNEVYYVGNVRPGRTIACSERSDVGMYQGFGRVIVGIQWRRLRLQAPLAETAANHPRNQSVCCSAS